VPEADRTVIDLVAHTRDWASDEVRPSNRPDEGGLVRAEPMTRALARSTLFVAQRLF
jgi:hypothetical protein